ncbi:MAG: hypothetical protein A3F26_02310 [Candidatus Ryanbacteria bacterium RIFCSPHIGHO2_12_FULL_47_12b]|uniref:Uncharacterized protein n=2 Tax=Candidatus Ryaniibacteriota TaxID=1817914 RepID=A0A1G2H3A1_9BACT|nr:MAG: hypothetical protein UX74_C0021G0010 [Parcubacteria group bacterium GW2011_GWA2_47_10b]KKU86249.1 MAG: hypothetical protein UY14_C0004G0006 [Parcubacteria group bacterium GW2011_GWA1_47_9]OGZ53218.1 MAG: hypothetical protein A3F26_02310 [Candidatus Ryanbacteria bacterium RIFCSPHIGHO2_12_FULL_47_12b]OGZ55011.1 MAG: hypothetical protein A3J04_01650 [Candidatus Ryanbacteria bacterium RIFCSPLOWO2_02_FULL_47_14]OGZ56829.1 MAG: hypothetical protein A3G60_01305 [Candidatus Ryanbacteria bacteri
MIYLKKITAIIASIIVGIVIFAISQRLVVIFQDVSRPMYYPLSLLQKLLVLVYIGTLVLVWIISFLKIQTKFLISIALVVASILSIYDYYLENYLVVPDQPIWF